MKHEYYELQMEDPMIGFIGTTIAIDPTSIDELCEQTGWDPKDCVQVDPPENYDPEDIDEMIVY